MIEWSVFIDIEGFSHFYESRHKERALELLRGLMLDLFKIGTTIYSSGGNRLFIYQFGDGFLVCPDIGDPDIERPISIGIALMRSTALRGGFARTAISQGDIGDILGCYPKEIQDRIEGFCVSLGEGLMTINRIMGLALINAYKLSMSKPQGPRLLTDPGLEPEIKKLNLPMVGCFGDHIEVDWIHSSLNLTDSIFKDINGFPSPPSTDLEKGLRDYIKSEQPPKEWEGRADILIQGPT